MKDGDLRIFESGAMMLYRELDPNQMLLSCTWLLSVDVGLLNLSVTDKYDKDHKISFPHGSPDYYEMLSWVMFQMGKCCTPHTTSTRSLLLTVSSVVLQAASVRW